MKLMKLITSASLVCVVTITAACKKEGDKPSPATITPAGSSANTPGPTAHPEAGSAAHPEPDSEPDHITVLAHHQPPKPTDPVRIHFEKFNVVSAAFDPLKVEGGKATVEIDLSSLHTDSDERDDNLKSPTYLDIAKFATATVSIDNVKQKAGTTYTADATVAAHGVTKTYPVTFEVLSREEDRIKVKGTHTFTRLDFGIGTDPAQNAEEQVGTDMAIEMVLTLAKE